MGRLTVYDLQGKQVGTYDIDPAELAPRISKQLLHDVVVMYQANLRQGNAKSKSRAEVAGSTKKMYRQKGTGNARAGSRRSGVRRGGGHIFAKRPRDFGYRLPRKAVQLATRMALASRLRDDEVTLIDQLSFSEPKTKQMAGVLRALKVPDGTSLLLAIADHDPNVFKSARNIDRVTVAPVSELTALNLLLPRRVLMTKAALDRVRQRAAEVKPKSDKPKATKPKSIKPKTPRTRAAKPKAARSTRATT
jgi:large subunit ribosomal protein L4